MAKRYLYTLHQRHIPRHVGNKAKSLHALHKKGFPIPPSYAVSWDLQKAYFQSNEHFPDAFRCALERVIDPEKTYAVRSSANVEDSKSHSYAGQFLSVLDVQGLEPILEAIRVVWISSNLETPSAYTRRQGDTQDNVNMGILLQEMVPAQLSGVAFSRNPVTGMDEVVVEAVEGSGDALMQEGVTPQRWIWKWGKWLQQPEASNVLQDLIQKIAVRVKEISTICSYPVDVEWVFDGERVIWLQARAITALQSIDVYANYIPKEFMPGVIKPLVWTVNVPLVNGAWCRLLTELIGDNQLDPLRLARSFHGYAYFNMGLLGSVFRQIGLPDNALERLMGFEAEEDAGPSFRPSLKALRYIPRWIKFVVEKALFDRKIESYLTHAQEKYAELEAQCDPASTATALVNHIEQLYALNQRTAYFNIVTPLLMQLYHQLAKRRLARQGIDYERINWLENWEDRADYDPVPHLQRLGAMVRDLDPIERQALASGKEIPSNRLAMFKEHLQKFMGRFGHLSDSGNDFSSPLWEETPAVVLNLIAGFADNPSPEIKEHSHNASREVISGGPFVQRAFRYSRYRERISFLYTHGVSMFRRAYQRIGADFCERGWLDDADDIFYLQHDEIVSAIQQEQPESVLGKLTQKRKQDCIRSESITLPPVIYGEQLPPILDSASTTLTGIATSRGLHRGFVRVVKGINDFPKVVDGCVLVIPYSDVSWTPLFARAGAIVAEAGGMLSHSSIVAREYGIPAIVSVPNATHLEDGVEVTVDGYSGNIILHETSVAEER